MHPLACLAGFLISSFPHRNGGPEMKRPLTEKEREILKFYSSHTCKETMARLDVAEWKVHSLKERQKRLEEEREDGKACFIEFPMEEADALSSGGNDSVSFSIGKRKFVMSLRDFRRAILDD